MIDKPKKKKKTGDRFVVVRGGAYWVDGEPVDAGTTLTLTKTEAAKLLHRGIIEET